MILNKSYYIGEPVLVIFSFKGGKADSHSQKLEDVHRLVVQLSGSCCVHP